MIERILSDGFFLGDLPAEIEALTKRPSIAAANRAALEAALRNAIRTQRRWPADKAGRIALTLWLTLGKNRAILTETRLHWPHEKIKRTGEAFKPSGMLIRRGLGKIGSGI